MLAEIFFGTLTSIVIYIILSVFFEEYDNTNIYLYYVYGIIFVIFSGLILIFRFPLSRMIYNIHYWNTVLVSSAVITIWIWIYVILKRTSNSK